MLNISPSAISFSSEAVVLTAVRSRSRWAAVQMMHPKKGSCAAGGAAGASSQNYWRVPQWGACSAPCGGGTQTRTATCVNAADGRSVPRSLPRTR